LCKIAGGTVRKDVFAAASIRAEIMGGKVLHHEIDVGAFVDVHHADIEIVCLNQAAVPGLGIKVFLNLLDDEFAVVPC
ncbi:MAG: hypothetical protein LUF30_10680, partial [Lachnospiraceae bacterium]|nr:hypothetical protein [Lachnospiraceae bacterium]